jgi:integrase
MHRQLGRASSQAYGINKDLLDKMIAATTNDIRGTRDKALLSLAYDTLCRRSEIVSFDITDVINKDGQIKIYLSKSKTDQDRLGKLISINNETQKNLLVWLKESRLISGKLFRGIKNNGQFATSLNKAQINKIYKKLAGKTDINKEVMRKISGHSTRVGAAQDLLKSKKSIAQIMQKGRWSKIDTVMRYIEAVNM